MFKQNFSFSLFSQYRGELMGIAILGVCLLHAFAWAGMGESLVCKAIAPFARIAFTDGFLFLSGFGLYYSFSKNGDRRAFYLKRFNRVFLPYVIMGLPFFLFGLFWGGVSFPKFLLKVTTLYFWLFGNDGMWYISMSVALYALFPFAYRFMFANQTEKASVARGLSLILACILGCLALYHYVPTYYNMLEIGIAKTPMFFIGMLVAYYACHNKVISWKHIFGGGYIAVYNFLVEKALNFCRFIL